MWSKYVYSAYTCILWVYFFTKSCFLKFQIHTAQHAILTISYFENTSKFTKFTKFMNHEIKVVYSSFIRYKTWQ